MCVCVCVCVCVFILCVYMCVCVFILLRFKHLPGKLWRGLGRGHSSVLSADNGCCPSSSPHWPGDCERLYSLCSRLGCWVVPLWGEAGPSRTPVLSPTSSAPGPLPWRPQPRGPTAWPRAGSLARPPRLPVAPAVCRVLADLSLAPSRARP